MKKWLISCMFIVCGICLHVGGFAKFVKTGYPGENISGYATTTGTFTFKKSSWSLCGYPNDNDTHIFFHHLSVSTLYSIVSYYKAGQNLFLSVSCYVSRKATGTREVERVLKDHLLHLFASHFSAIDIFRVYSSGNYEQEA